MMSETVYFIRKHNLETTLCFTDSENGGEVTVPSTSEIRIEYKAIPKVDVGSGSNVDLLLAKVVIWAVAQTLFSLKKDRVGYALARESKEKLTKLLLRTKNLSSRMVIKAYDNIGGSYE